MRKVRWFIAFLGVATMGGAAQNGLMFVQTGDAVFLATCIFCALSGILVLFIAAIDPKESKLLRRIIVALRSRP